ncbi:hypothetical protein JR316_0011964 [Psilocybe cubensis]|uniref:Uncharacterized protein n=1 Tax=Psilocybe cubensis TaxID=181762 RepID=A0ACB8GMW4_PSICU|nr:hypothetical protein JR316_0011964 [Psilocybe cubensis]KAH9476389.1 hypothetical protein JR316_0011964 [Psilocybe cubensis]
MDFLKKVANEVESATKNQAGSTSESNGKTENQSNPTTAVLGALNNALGGGAQGEKKEAIDLVQEHVLKAGDQSNESAIEQAKDAQIASAIRTGYKTVTGKEFPISESQKS